MSKFLDIHTHILPHMDDGSPSSRESAEMLSELSRQGAGTVVATPHFYARHDEPGEFLKNRDETARHLVKRLNEFISCGDIREKMPRICLGAEVAFFNAMSNVTEMKEMCISGTSFLLVEMPFDRWTSAMYEELYNLNKKQGITPILAHIDRYFGCFKERALDELIQNGIKIQINADAFLSIFSRRRSLDMVKDGRVHFLGSDAHNMQKRAPNYSSAVDEMVKRLGEESLSEIKESSDMLIKQMKPIFPSNGAEE